MSGTPDDAIITKVEVYYEISHPRPQDLDVWLTAYYDGGWHDFVLYNQGDLGNEAGIVEFRSNIHAWNGASPNQTFYLVVRDNVSGEQGSIDFFELWISYNTDSDPAAAAEISDVSFDKSKIAAGKDTINATISLYNSGNLAGSFFISSSSIMDGGDTWYDLEPLQTSIDLNPGESGTVSFVWTPDDSVQAGTYGLYTAVFTDSSGSDIYTDDWRDAAFAVVEPTTGAIQVNITPQSAVDAGAYWRLTGGYWQASGITLSDLSEGTYTIEYSSAYNYITPSSQAVTVTSGQTIMVTCQYSDSNEDSDADGFPDLLEMTCFGDLTHSPDLDDDGDGIYNRIECVLGLNPVFNEGKQPGIFYEYDKLGRITRIERLPAR